LIAFDLNVDYSGNQELLFQFTKPILDILEDKTKTELFAILVSRHLTDILAALLQLNRKEQTTPPKSDTNTTQQQIASPASIADLTQNINLSNSSAELSEQQIEVVQNGLNYILDK
jgi:hypothetical protein